MHRGRAVCSAVAGMTSGCSAAAVEPIDRLGTICVLPKSGARDRETSETDQIRKTKIGEAGILRGTCEIDGPAALHAIVVLAA